MKSKRLIIVAVFMVLVAGLLLDFKPLSAQGPCHECGASAGAITKCDGMAAVTNGELSGNCVTVVGDVRIDENMQPVNCTITAFYNCPETEAGCPLSKGPACTPVGSTGAPGGPQ